MFGVELWKKISLFKYLLLFLAAFIFTRNCFRLEMTPAIQPAITSQKLRNLNFTLKNWNFSLLETNFTTTPFLPLSCANRDVENHLNSFVKLNPGYQKQPQPKDLLDCPGACLSFEERYKHANFAVTVLPGFDQIRAEVVILKLHKSIKINSDFIISSRALINEVVSENRHVVLFCDGDSIPFGIPNDLKPFVLYATESEIQKEFPGFGGHYGFGDIAVLWIDLFFRKQHQRSWLIEYDVRFIGNWANLFDCAIEKAFRLSDAHYEGSFYKHGSMIDQDADLILFGSINEHTIATNWVWAQCQTATTASRVFSSISAILGLSRNLLSAFYFYTKTLNYYAYVELNLLSIAYKERLKTVDFSFNTGDSRYNVDDNDDAQIYYKSFVLGKISCLKNALIHKVKYYQEIGNPFYNFK